MLDSTRKKYQWIIDLTAEWDLRLMMNDFKQTTDILCEDRPSLSLIGNRLSIKYKELGSCLIVEKFVLYTFIVDNLNTLLKEHREALKLNFEYDINKSHIQPK